MVGTYRCRCGAATPSIEDDSLEKARIRVGRPTGVKPTDARQRVFGVVGLRSFKKPAEIAESAALIW